MWTDIISAIASGVALIFSFFSLRQSRRSLRISEKQEERYQPNLIASLYSGDYEVMEGDNDRQYRFVFSVQNRSDAHNAIIRVELMLTCRLPEGIAQVVRVEAAPGSGLPFRLEARDSIKKECLFSVPSITWQNTIEDYTVELVDTYDRVVTMKPILLSQRKA